MLEPGRLMSNYVQFLAGANATPRRLTTAMAKDVEGVGPSMAVPCPASAQAMSRVNIENGDTPTGVDL